MKKLILVLLVMSVFVLTSCELFVSKPSEVKHLGQVGGNTNAVSTSSKDSEGGLPVLKSANSFEEGVSIVQFERDGKNVAALIDTEGNLLYSREDAYDLAYSDGGFGFIASEDSSVVVNREGEVIASASKGDFQGFVGADKGFALIYKYEGDRCFGAVIDQEGNFAMDYTEFDVSFENAAGFKYVGNDSFQLCVDRGSENFTLMFCNFAYKEPFYLFNCNGIIEPYFDGDLIYIPPMGNVGFNTDYDHESVVDITSILSIGTDGTHDFVDYDCPQSAIYLLCDGRIIEILGSKAFVLDMKNNDKTEIKVETVADMEDVHFGEDGYVVEYKDESCSLFDSTGGLLLGKTNSESFVLFWEGILVSKDLKGKHKFYDSDGGITAENLDYDSVLGFENGIGTVEKKGEYSFVSSDGKRILTKLN